MPVDPDTEAYVQDQLRPLRRRMTAVEKEVDALQAVPAIDLAPVIARLDDLSTRLAALEDGSVTPPPPPDPIPLPSGFTRMDRFKIGTDWDDPTVNAYLPTWAVGHRSWGDPTLIAWRPDGSVVINGIKAPTPEPSRWWRTGAIQFKRPAGIFGRVSAVVHVTDPSAVAAFWCYHRNIEIDFELIREDGVPVWALSVHVMGADGTMKHNRTPLRAAFSPNPQMLAWNRQRDRIDFELDGNVVATVRPADMQDGAWNATDAADLFLSVEGHDSWAGWDYASGKAKMAVGGLKFDYFEDAVSDPDEPPVAAIPSVGANLDGAFDYSPARFSADVLKMQRTGWSGATQSAIAAASDADGYLVRMPAGASSVSTYIFTELPAAMVSAAGRYRLRWRGKGTVEICGQTITATGQSSRWIDYRPDGGVRTITYRAIDPADPIRLLDMVHERNIDSFDAGDPFDQHHLETLEPLGLLRLMDWGATNGSPLSSWQDRPLPSNRTWTSAKGVPLEIMIALANRRKQPIWYCFPHLATDGYVAAAAALFRDTLDEDVPLYLELSNEGWNDHYAFSQTPWFRTQGAARWPSIDRESARCQWIAGRTVEIKRIFAQAFGPSFAERVRMILGGFAENDWFGDVGLTGRDWQIYDRDRGGDGLPPARHIYGYAIAAYYGYSLQNNATLKTILANSGLAAAVDEGIAIMRRDLEGLPAKLAKHKAVADKHGVKLMMYEGGSHANPQGSAYNDAAYVDLLHRIHRDPRQADMQKRWLDIWRDAGGQELCIFSATGRPSKDGFWGFKEHDDDLNAPRWVGAMEWNNNNPQWWT